MLERHFALPRNADRVRALWLGSEIERYVGWLYERRAAASTVSQHLQTLVQFNNFAVARGARTVADLPDMVDDFTMDWMSARGRWCRDAHDVGVVRSHGRVPVEQMLSVALAGFAVARPKKSLPFHTSAPGFFAFLRDERGLRPNTIRGYVVELRALEAYLQRLDIVALTTLTPSTITQFVIERAAPLLSGGSRRYGGAPRTFLRYLHRQGILPKDLSASVPRMRHYKQTSIPRSIPWSEVQRLLASVDRRTPGGRRDYAILQLLANYGLRAREIAAMQMEDIDWEQAHLRVPTRKGGHSTLYPLLDCVGEAIVEHLRGRAAGSDERHLFVSTKMPYGPVRNWSVSAMVGKRLKAAGIEVGRPGSHTLRHSCVQRMVDADVPFKVIGDFVGHKWQASTMVYGKVAVHRLRELAIGGAEEAL